MSKVTGNSRQEKKGAKSRVTWYRENIIFLFPVTF